MTENPADYLKVIIENDNLRKWRKVNACYIERNADKSI